MPPGMPYTPGQQSGGGGGVKGRVLRPLGTIRHSSLPDSSLKFPPLKQSTDYGNDGLQGIHGSAMTLPPPKPLLTDRPSPDSDEPRPVAQVQSSPTRHPNPSRSEPSRSDSHSSRSEPTQPDDSKHRAELKEAAIREKHLKQQVMSLQKVIDELKAQIRERDQTISSLQLQFQRQEEQYKEMYEREQRCHDETRQELRVTESERSELRDKLDLARRDHKHDLEQLKQSLEQKMTDAVAEKDREISVRDEKLSRLKHQMADALKGNSWERQQQLDELTKELTRVQEEADMLRLKMKSSQARSNKVGGSDCSNCDSLNSRLSQHQSALSDRDKMIFDLKTACAKLEKQIAQQEEVFRQQGHSKGLRSKGPHK